MNTLYIKCDSCGGRIALHNSAGLDDAPLLVERARKAGWTGEMTVDSTNDKCPGCSEAPPTGGTLDW